MKILLSWLKDYVDIDIAPSELVGKLFGSGFEVEESVYLGEGIEKVVVGEVTSIDKYEGTHLWICHVDCGKHGSDITILTGADNVFKGAKVPAALVGAKLPGGLEISPRNMVGMMSYGMLCSGAELGVSGDWCKGADVNGILILPADAENGRDIKDVLELDDYVFDISITANRPDCQSVLGIAREVAAFLGKPLKEPDYSYAMTEVTNPEISVEVIDKDLCPRFLGHYIYDVKHFESPQWMKRRLSVCGFSAIDAIVDVTNYVLLEIGQPMHAYDLDTLSGKSIVVRRAKDGESIVTLDEKKRELNSGNLLICDKEKGVGLAGIMGGLNSEIEPSTKEILLESAKFVKESVRKTSRALGLHTDAAARFEKGVDEYGAERGMARALNLVQSLEIASVSSSAYDVSAGASTEERRITVDTNKINRVLGITVPDDTIVSILRSLQFGVEVKEEGGENGARLLLTIPRWREDIENYQDIAEEVIREYGYNHVVPTFLDSAKVTKGGMNPMQEKELSVKKFLCTEGCYEVQTLAMYSRKELDMLLLPDDAEERRAVELLNPITENLSIMRTVMAPCMINVIAENIKTDHSEGRFFELANVYLPYELPLKRPPVERKTLCIGAYGAGESFFTVKEITERLAAEYGLEFGYARDSVAYLHPGQTAAIFCAGKKVGVIGKLRYEVIDGLNIAEGKKTDLNIIIAEINYSLLSTLFKREIKYVPESAYVSVKRDLSLIVDKNTSCAEVTDGIKSACELVSGVSFVDLYENIKLGLDKKSLTFTLTLSAPDKDVTDALADEAVAAVVAALSEKFGAKQR